MLPTALSILDLAPVLSGFGATKSIRCSLDLARHAEELGYHRYWFAEHHNMIGIASSSPEVLIGHIAQATKKIRVGSGGIMLPNHAPLRVAEAFRTLEALYPGRIDLGLGRAPGSGSRAALALRGSEHRMRADDFPEQLQDLIAFLTDDLPEHHAYRGVLAMPIGVQVPELWILGSSDFGARLAAEHGLPYAFAQHFSPLPAQNVLDLYRRHFKASKWLQTPRTILATHIICAETDETAQELAMSSDLSFFLFRQTGKSSVLPTVQEAKDYPFSTEDWKRIRESSATQKFVGSPETLKKQLFPFLEEAKVDELMVLTMTHDQEARRKSYSLIKDLFASA